MKLEVVWCGGDVTGKVNDELCLYIIECGEIGRVVIDDNEKVEFSCGVSGELVAVICDVVTLRKMCDVIAGCYVERLLKCV